MSLKQYGHYISTIAIITVLCSLNTAAARQTIVNGSIGVGFDYESRTYDDPDLVSDPNDGDVREYSIIPEIEIQSLGARNQLTFRYSPVLVYDDLIEDTDLDHYLDLQGEQFFTQNWSFEFIENFVYSTDPSRYDRTFITGAEEIGGEVDAPDEITQNLGRTRYWTNNLTLQTTYTYAEESDVELGYAYRILRNDSSSSGTDEEYDEYDRHQVFGLLSRRFSSSYSGLLDLSYIRGLYDEDDVTGLSGDLDEYDAGVILAYQQDMQNTFPVEYRFFGSEFEDDRVDTWVHNVTFGWEHSFDSRNSMVIGAGPSYVDADGYDGEWGYNANVLLRRAYQHGGVTFSAEKGYDPNNFSGSTDSGLRDYATVGVDATYQFTQSLNSSIFANYIYEDILQPQEEYLTSALGGTDPATITQVGDISYDRQGFSVGASLEYTFWRWFVASAQYTYFIQDGDLAEDSYEDHRIFLQISASKELWR